jgi:cyclopropane-fatty-acyl-phospholipid synthase
MDGDFDMERGELYELLTLLLRNGLGDKVQRDWRLLMRVAAIRTMNRVRGKTKSVRAHYDIGDELFESFLDSTLTYSCGYASSPSDDLEALQRNKLDRICRKLELKPGERLVDIGCGYGGLMMHAAEHYGVTTVGITLSRRHYEKGSALVRERGLEGKVAFHLGDYRDLDGTFDKLVTIGMMEHVPRSEYTAYTGTIARLLAPHGRGLVHTIGRSRASSDHDPFIQRYIFPNTDTPRLSVLAGHLERQGLAIIDVENMVRHYGWTVLGWLRNFRENSHSLPAKYDGRFRRMWEYYFACGIAASRAAHSALWQVLFVKDHTSHLSLRRV